MRNFFVVLSLIIFIGPAISAESLGQNPEAVTKYIEYISAGEGKSLIAETEYKSVLYAGYASIVDVLSNLEGAASLFPNVKESLLIPAGSNEINRKIKASYKFLGIGRSYKYTERINIYAESDNECIVESKMIKSLDQRLNDYRGEWRISRLPDTLDGRLQTAVSLYSYFDYNNPFFMQDVVLKSFADEEVTRMFECVENAAGAESP